MFVGLLYCADCGRKLYFNVNHPNTELKYFNGSNYKGNRGTCTDTHLHNSILLCSFYF